MIRTTASTKPAPRREQQPAALTSYRCPACGEMVDNRDLDAVRFHHYHVLHPRRDLFVTLPVVGPRGGANGAQRL